MNADDVSRELTEFVRERFLDGDMKDDLEDTTPLLEWGVLNSMNIAILLNHIRDELGTKVPPGMINGDNFKSIETLTAMVVSLSGEGVAAEQAAGEKRAG